VPLTAPGVGQVLVKVGAAGVNPVETYIRAGAYAKLPSLPYTPGNDLAGTVIATGPNVESCKVGDRVYSSMCVTGSHSSHAICDSENLQNKTVKN
jgi:NADPH:quinone reductase